ncbi:hypothetical protein P3S67_009813 [Capsicum chacoense]|uniref:uncharacterized protein LOC124892916 n=1 Tax=Capsicum annuum TaxID=4072 RepID=UPI001FB0D064|nr:uncharacterized protein LOC124892916 [Capsicum annuum]KAF3623699.1 putative proline--tRNA ligase C19C7.06-like [Capsicum annuum]KAF3630732.1 putative proline--tRNA ligase C19C7.06-like [Capsicum annuum]
MASSPPRNRLHNSNLHRSVSPSGRFCSSTISSTFATPKSDWLTRPTSPTRVNLGRSISPSPSVRFSNSPSRSISVFPRNPPQNTRPLASNQKKHCSCSPTTHPGSFRCSLHRNRSRAQSHTSSSSYRSSQHLNMRRSAMTNSLVRIGTVEGELVKRALSALIRPSSHQLKRRDDFQPRPSRLSVMSKAEDF